MIDIFKAGPKGALWLGTVEDMAEATTTVKKIYALNPGKYFTFEVSTQTRHVMTPEELGEPTQSGAAAIGQKPAEPRNR